MLTLLAALAAASTSADREAVRSAIVAGAEACSSGDPAGSMASVDRDLVLSYPDGRDRTYDGLAAGYARLCKGEGENTVVSTTPEFEEVTVNGDVAIARLIWTTHLRGMPEGAYRKMRDFQVWRRTPEGWRFWRGAHWPYSDERPR
jgi:ketosteroid isomerase-like protein